MTSRQKQEVLQQLGNVVEYAEEQIHRNKDMPGEHIAYIAELREAYYALCDLLWGER